ncbi:MAG: TetR/AcrR family transcriptional regulator [Ilumatobacteraceae bacterium]
MLDATLEVLADVGFTGLTMEMVAHTARARKATLYRRGPSKSELIVDAVGRLKRSQEDIEHLPTPARCAAISSPCSRSDHRRRPSSGCVRWPGYNPS